MMSERHAGLRGCTRRCREYETAKRGLLLRYTDIGECFACEVAYDVKSQFQIEGVSSTERRHNLRSSVSPVPEVDGPR